MSERSVGYLSEAPAVLLPFVAHDGRVEYEYGVAVCYYCGEPAGTVDHVVPQSMLETLRVMGDDAVTAVLARHGRRMTVPSCLECNVVLGNKYFDTLEQRKQYLKRRMRQRYAKILRVPDWTDRELSQLGPRLQQAVIGAVVKRDVILRRLRY